MGQGYWQEIARRRINRRAALRGTAIAGLGVTALSLIGCGSDENGSGGASSSGSSSSSGGGASSGASGASSGLVYKPVDTSGTAKRGGVLPSILTSDTPSFSAYHSVAV
ncbi:MAG TPA: hypothetical protein VFY10_01725, partial [Dehalococcoidia bacterium]|nr:hypothetical protein [Dehalococcoidia bacterium]